MDKAIQGEFRLSKGKRMGLAVGLILFVSFSIVIFMKLHLNITTIVQKQAVDSITNISQLNEESVSRAILNRKTLLEVAAKRLSRDNIEDVDVILDDLADLRESYDFYSIGVMDESRKVYLTNGRVLDVSGMSVYENAWDDAFHFTESYMPADGGKYAINTFSCPIYCQEELRYILVATYRSKNLTTLMNISSMGGKGYNFIINGDSEVVIYPKFYENEAYNGLMKYVNDSLQVSPSERRNAYFEYNGDRYYAHFERMEINNWYLMTCAKESDVFEEANRILRVVSFGMGVIWLFIMLAISTSLLSMIRSKREIRQAVFYDDLVGVGNANALRVFFRKTPEEERCRMALVIFDIDRFKEFNYLYGEECGDELLKYMTQVFEKELPDDYLFRYLADRFVALVHCESQQEFVEKFERYLGVFTEDIENGDIQPFDVSAGVRRIHKGEPLRRILSDALIAKGTIKGIQLQ